MKNKFPYVLIILGLFVMIYPLANNLYSSYWENRMLDEAEQLLDSENFSSHEEDLSQTVVHNFTRVDEVFAGDGKDEEPTVDGFVIDEEVREIIDNDSSQETHSTENDPSNRTIQSVKPGEVIGKIEIPSIGVNLPLLLGSDPRTLDRGAGQIIGTAAPGQIGNTGIAGHRANRDGKFFYRLNELGAGDEIILKTREGTFVYTVYETKIVNPTDVWVLNRNQTDRIVTLITCHPRYTADYRLIVHGKISREN